MAGVILENVSREYPGGTLAVADLSLEIRDREFLVLVGPSGCGKTTTLRLIAGLEELSGGRITIGSRDVSDVPAKARDIAMVFQNYALYPHMTVYRNMAFGLELREGIGGWTRWWRWAAPGEKKKAWARRRFAIAERVQEAARTLAIQHLLDRYPRQLSGGERQRVALGRAIVRHPAVFLFDEPLSNLDAKLRVEMRRELKQLHQRLATTMVYVTHDQVEALTLGDRIVVMQGGKIQQVGTPREVYDRPANRFVAGFIGTPAMNFLDGKLESEPRPHFRRGDWTLPLGAGSLADGMSIDDRPVTLGIRPEDVRIVPPGTSGEKERDGAIKGVVELVEMQGEASIATIRLEEEKQSSCVLSRIESRARWRPGMQVGVELNQERVHLFDRTSGENLVHRPQV